jgi:very-short-patch-repair endonuclease
VGNGRHNYKNNIMPIPDIIKDTARKLRKGMTKAEKELWEDLRR